MKACTPPSPLAAQQPGASVNRNRAPHRPAAAGSSVGPHLRLGLLGVPALFLLLTSSVLVAQPPAEEVRDRGSVDEEITVSETGVLLDFRGILSPRQVRELAADEIRVREDEVPRTTVRLEPILRSPDDRWHLLVYVDAVLSTEETVRQSALTLAQHAPAMVRLGEVRVLIDDGEVRELLPPTRSITRIEDVLAELGKRPVAFDRLTGLRQRFDTDLARATGDDTAIRRAAAAQEADLVRRQVDALIRTVGGGCPTEACSLLLVSDGFELRPDLYYLGAELAERYPESSVETQRAAVSLAESLAALEWITLAMPMRPAERVTSSEDKPRGSPDSDWVRFRQQAGTHVDGITITRKRERSALDRLSIENLGALILPTLQPLRMVADETAGGLVRTPDLLEPELESLAERFRVWYRTSRAVDGQIRPVEVFLVAGNRPLRTPYWTDASTPEGVAAARARGLLEGSAGPGTLPVRVEIEDAAVVATVDWGNGSPSMETPRIPLRISVAVAANGDPRAIHHQVSELAPSGDATTTSHRVEAPLPEEGVVAVVVEDLRNRVWGGARLRLP